MQISDPGIYDLPNDAYHADPCLPMSLSSTGARKLTTDCPAMFKYERDNQGVRKRAFDIGTAGHLMVLEPEKFEEQIVLVEGFTKDGKPSAGYATTDAKEQRDAAYAAGKTPLLKPELDMLQEMRSAIWNDPVVSKAFVSGEPEKSMFWQDEETGIWCRCRPDFLPRNGRYLLDYKTADDANPEKFQKRAFDMGYHQQAAWYLEGYRAVTGEDPTRFWFIVQSKKPPYLVSICEMDPYALQIGEARNRYAKGALAWCLKHDEWPGYRPTLSDRNRVFQIAPPAWVSKEYDRQMEEGSLEPPAVSESKIEEFV